MFYNNSPPASWQSRAHDLRSCGASFDTPIFAAYSFTTCQTTFSVIPSPQTVPARQTRPNSLPFVAPASFSQSSIVRFTQSGTGTVRMRPFPTRSMMAQCSSRRWRWSSVRSDSSRRRSPQPSKTARIARSRLLFGVPAFGSCQRERACSAVNQFRKRTPNLLDPFTLRIPAASSGLSKPASAASSASLRHGRESHIRSSRRHPAIFEVNPVTGDNCLVEGQARL